jgi:hypothetical protein
VRWFSRVAPLLAVAVLGLSCADDFRVCEEAPASAELPRRLSETGLYQAGSNEALAPGVVSFTPQFELWSDGAQKRRFLFMPAESRIDTTDMDDWQFPPGTMLWKEFSRGGVRVETRLLAKRGPRPEDWAFMAYAWQPDGADALAVPEGVNNARGTPHDIPAAADCRACHDGRKSRVLGFSAVQLAHDSPEGSLDLADLIARDLLTHPPTQAPAVPGDQTARAALGYLHANCGHCHNQDRPPRGPARCFDPENRLDFHLPARPTTVTATPAVRTGAGFAFEPGDPRRGRLLRRMQSRGDPDFASMPPLGTEEVHTEAVELLKRWIADLPR